VSSLPLPIVELTDVSARVGVTTIVRDVHFILEPGEVVGLFGSNGAGKTTLLRVLATLHRPAEGEGRVLGADLSGPARFDVRGQIGLIGHVPSLYPELTLRENLEFVAQVIGQPPGEVDRALAAVGLGGVTERAAAACSYGMQRRAEFAREIMRSPRLLLLDEPHSALDASALGVVEHLVRSVCESGGGAVLVSHDRERVERLADRTVELSGGSLR
jgi:heme ABC exporter ATP-binding subunit CcmA